MTSVLRRASVEVLDDVVAAVADERVVSDVGALDSPELDGLVFDGPDVDDDPEFAEGVVAEGVVAQGVVAQGVVAQGVVAAGRSSGVVAPRSGGGGAASDLSSGPSAADLSAGRVAAAGKARRELTERQRGILVFERLWWRHAGSKEQAIREQFDLSATRYYQMLNRLLEMPEALEFDPLVVGRLRRLRATRSRTRMAT
jgi:hypothetical protein